LFGSLKNLAIPTTPWVTSTTAMGHGDAAAGATFPVMMNVLTLSYLAMLLVQYLDLLDVLSRMCMIKNASAFAMLFWVIQLTRKLPNVLTLLSRKIDVSLTIDF
jgi:hypothetical protein